MVVTVKVKDLPYQTSIAQVDRHRLEVRLDKVNKSPWLRHADQFDQGLPRIAQIWKQALAPRDIERVVRERQPLRVSLVVFDRKIKAGRSALSFIQKLATCIEADEIGR